MFRGIYLEIDVGLGWEVYMFRILIIMCGYEISSVGENNFRVGIFVYWS